MDSKAERSDLDQEEAVSGCEAEVSGEISVLGEDLLNEILLRLPPSSLLSCTSVSKSWHRLCASAPFRLSYRSLRVDYFTGFFVNFPCRSPLFIRSSSSSSPSPVVTDLGSVQILDSRGGWLLLRDIATTSLRLFHPIINETLSVAPTSLETPTGAFYVLLPDPFSSNPLRRFRILRFMTKPSSHLQIEIFLSEFPGEWKRVQSSFHIRTQRCFSEPHPVLVDGFLHWLNGGLQILALDERSCCPSIIGLPRALPLYLTHRCLGKLNGRLSYAYVEESTLYIWVLVDRFYNEWSLEHQIEMVRFQELGPSQHIRPIAFGGGGSSPALFLGWMERIFSLDLGCRRVTELCNVGFEVDHVFPYSSMEGKVHLFHT